jgi:hypothetical protein
VRNINKNGCGIRGFPTTHFQRCHAPLSVVFPKNCFKMTVKNGTAEQIFIYKWHSKMALPNFFFAISCSSAGRKILKSQNNIRKNGTVKKIFIFKMAKWQ